MGKAFYLFAFVFGIISVFGVYIFISFFLDLFNMKISKKRKQK